jgi:hypothetical protein
MYTISLEPSRKGQVTATSSDGHAFTITTPLLECARYWLNSGADPAASIVTVWSSGKHPLVAALHHPPCSQTHRR